MRREGKTMLTSEIVNKKMKEIYSIGTLERAKCRVVESHIGFLKTQSLKTMDFLQ